MAARAVGGRAPLFNEGKQAKELCTASVLLALPASPAHAQPPKPRRRVVLVRHGQSTWNARNRIQGSSNFSVLTELGVEQAQAARKLVRSLSSMGG